MQYSQYTGIRELGIKAVNGSADVDDTVDKIQKKAAIRLSGRGRNDGSRNSIVSMGNMPF